VLEVAVEPRAIELRQLVVELEGEKLARAVTRIE
jgi:hypothetical protein